MKQHETLKSIAARFARRPFLRKIISAMACVALAGTLASPLAHANHLQAPDMSMKTVGEVLAEDGRFTTLLAALQATGLDTALAEAGPFTIFAPTDEAFARLPAGTVQSLLANPDALKNILLYHVASGDLNTAELAAQRNISTLQDASARIYSAFGRTYVNNAFIQTGNIDASNGIVHAISRVLLPPTH